MTQQRSPRRPRKLEEDAPFEAVVERLEAIVQQLEEGELPLEQSLEAFEEGVLLARRASGALDAMERRIEVLTQEGSLEPLEEQTDDGDRRDP